MEWLEQIDLLTPVGIATFTMVMFGLLKQLGFKRLKQTTVHYPIYAMLVILLISIVGSFGSLLFYDAPPDIKTIIINGIGAALVSAGQHEWFSNIWRALTGIEKKRFLDSSTEIPIRKNNQLFP